MTPLFGTLGRTDLGIEVEMPPFGEALGDYPRRFHPTTEVKDKDGQSVQIQTQRYGLQANRSGEVVIPALRIGYRLTVDADWKIY